MTSFFRPLHILVKTAKEGDQMGGSYSGEDLDDLIFGEEEWSASQR